MIFVQPDWHRHCLPLFQALRVFTSKFGCFFVDVSIYSYSLRLIDTKISDTISYFFLHLFRFGSGNDGSSGDSIVTLLADDPCKYCNFSFVAFLSLWTLNTERLDSTAFSTRTIVHMNEPVKWNWAVSRQRWWSATEKTQCGSCREQTEIRKKNKE